MAKNREQGITDQQEVPNGLVTLERMKQLEEENAKLLALAEENAKLKEALAKKDLETTDVLKEMRKELQEVRTLKGELQVTLDTARIANKQNILPTQEPNLKDIIKIDLGTGPDGRDIAPPQGAFKKQYRVTLPDCASRIVEIWEVPGAGFASYDLARNAFNKYFGIISSDKSYDIKEVTGPEPVIAPMQIPQPMNTTNVPSNPELAVATGEFNDPKWSKMDSLMSEMVS